MDDLNPAGIGHNSQLPYDPEVVEKLQARIRELADAGGAWLDLKVISDDEQAGKVNDFLTQARAAYKDVEAARKKAKQPHLDAGTAVDVKFKSLTAPLEKLAEKLKKPLAAFQTEKQRQLDEERLKKQEEARRQQEEADRLRREAEARNDVIAEAEAEKAAKAAAKATKAAARPVKAQIASATGGGRTMSARTTYRAKIDDHSAARRAFSFLLNDPDSSPVICAEIERLCTAARRRKDGPSDIPGVTWLEERTVA
ncbi:CCDC34 family protein [Paracoccus onubensis]|uniref:Uncharacterized protein n=1 Tax=Paracoccus onubensis TaxID=1675788 RepID=A0A418SPY0_9RHOB|nr:hypothetical protein [Paracoccus onubensis]RJE82972.1 hypothetical protein D3P04_18265 [Paracoccus onubensis]